MTPFGWQRFKRLGLPVTLTIIAAILAVYWPVSRAGFVWDDRIFLHNAAWLRQGDEWVRHVFHAFFESKNYFRPLGVAGFVAEMRLFDVNAGAMHLVSLALHLANVLVVGLLARRLLAFFPNGPAGTISVYAAMLVFGMHPLLVEPVVWISCQFELLATLLILGGLVGNLALRNTLARSLFVATCFFLAACAKEAAVAFPVLLAILDWIRLDRSKRSFASEWRSVQLPVYLAVFAAGVAYLALRLWGMGYLVAASTTENLHLGTRLQLVSYTYLTYWKVILWPMRGLGPLHIIDASRFTGFSLVGAAVDAGALALVAFGTWQFWWRRALGALIVSVTAALVPVLRLFPVDFDDSIYHDRFAMTAIAMACAFAPATIADLSLNWSKSSGELFRRIAAFACVAWLALAVLNVRVTIPLWSDETRLWQWVLREQPDSLFAQVNLLAIYIEHGDLVRARELASLVKTSGKDSTNCMLNVAQLAILDHDAEGASEALALTQQAMKMQAPFPQQVVGYVKLTGDLRRLRGDLTGAEEAYRDAIALDPLIPTTHLSLAVVLNEQGKTDAARSAAKSGLALLAPDDRLRHQQEFEKLLNGVPKEDPPDVPAAGN